MQAVWHQVEKVAPTKTTVLITGETGVGKEVIAQAIHEGSPRKNRPFKAVNCGAFYQQDLLQSELFGHEKGAFTGATKLHRGMFEQANGGTLFLDEVGEMSPEVQVKFLRVLETQEFTRLGGARNIKVDVRIIAATNADLEAAVRETKFRQDIYYRLNKFHIPIPPLRDRREDIPLFVTTFIIEISREFDKRIDDIPSITPEALDYLQNNDWRGNVRELKNVIETAILLATDRCLKLEDFQIKEPLPIKDPKIESLKDSEKSEKSEVVKAAFSEIFERLRKWKEQEDESLKSEDTDNTDKLWSPKNKLWSLKNLECLSIYCLHQQLEWDGWTITKLTEDNEVSRNTFNRFKKDFEGLDAASRKNGVARIQEGGVPSENSEVEEKRDPQISPDTKAHLAALEARLAALEARLAP